ncbi:MAG: MFS transporter [Candidatus Velthaea sp.]
MSGDVATRIQAVAFAWHIFTLHHQPLDLGLVGFTLFLPSVLLVLVSGYMVDRYDRKSIVMIATVIEIAATLGFLHLALAGETRLWPYLAVILVIGAARAFASPAERSLLVNLVAPERYVAMSATYSTVRQLLIVGGPAAGGALVASGTVVALWTVTALLSLSVVALVALRMPARTPFASGEAPTLRDALGGLHFIRSNPVILGAISLDLFAVLFGGATALLPVYADTILRVGPVGLGILRSAPAAGAFATALFFSRRPPAAKVGRTLLTAVAIFGTAIIVFGLSHDVRLSLGALAVAGAADMVSVVIRSGLVQLNTPDAMRGRVNAVENVFIGASNELGEFESGTLAALIGSVPAVVAGGAGTLAVCGLWFVMFPQLRRADALISRPQA